MRRSILLLAVAVALFALVPVAGASPASHTDYTFESTNFPLDNPFDHVTHQADGWLLVSGAPMGGIYVATDIGAAWVEESVNGKISADFATGAFHGPITLTAEDLFCEGRFNAQRANFVETNPVPVKTAMSLLGFCKPVFRPPLGPAEPRTVELLRQALERSDLPGGER